ncbi:7187_t:CDS:2 [Cetraspora pellucida]|uniref:7187_t:CDS:1 n=1 Tax=Cetraspora pellucida TaxID=1433469 RepID=A0ACA9KLT0_9GLOM|nr:7187_t:CDS:2 [Cetraspora pellucida]
MGNSSSSDGVAKTLTGLGVTAALGVTTFFCPPLGAAMTYSAIGTGTAATLTGIAADSEDLRDAGIIVLGSGLGNLGGGYEVIQPLEPKVYYELSEREGAYYDAPCHSLYTEKSMVKSCLPTKTEKGISYGLGPRGIKDKVDKIKNEPDFYEYSPFLTLAKELLKLVKENKVEVIFLSAYDKRVFLDGDPRKKKIFKETFGRFSNCSLNLLGFDSEGQGQTKGE